MKTTPIPATISSVPGITCPAGRPHAHRHFNAGPDGTNNPNYIFEGEFELLRD